MIKTILLKNVATYDSKSGVYMDDLKKLNFFFGSNGSGKSTIAKYLYSLSLAQNPEPLFNSCSQSGYNTQEEQILVFDENFKDINFNRSAHVKGIFSLNKTNDELDKKIKECEKEIEDYNRKKQIKTEKKESIKENKTKYEDNLLEYCWSQRNFFSAFSKIELACSRSKQNHLQRIKDHLEKSFDSNISSEQIIDEYNILYEKNIEKIENEIDYDLCRQIIHNERKLNHLLQEIIVGNEAVDIAGLINTLNSRNWVEEGVGFLAQTGTKCPFCQQETINEDLKKQFDAFFDETYKTKIEKLKLLLDEYRGSSSRFSQNIFEIQNVYNLENITSNLYIKVKDLFQENILVIENKLKNPNEKKRLASMFIFKQDLLALIEAINENNKIFLEMDERKSLLIENIWNFMANKCKDEIEKCRNKEKRCERINDLRNLQIEKYDKRISILQTHIEELRKQTVSTKDAVDNINQLLRRSGFESFEICENEKINNVSQYYLKRPNASNSRDIYKTLSEGEKSFISFLYFYQLCIGTDDIQNHGSKKKIIVIDDPISSLDSQTLFVISSLVRQLITKKKEDHLQFQNKNIAQVFILTHNVYFYKEVAFVRNTQFCKDHYHYSIKKNNNTTSITTGNKEPVVFDDYSMLWDTLKKIKISLPQDSSLNVIIANTMRRIIESYVNFIGIGTDSWSIFNEIAENSPEYFLMRAFISEINDESHKVSALDSIYYHKLSNETPQVLFSVFKNIFKEIGPDHYLMMMKEPSFDEEESLIEA
jgi:wobble nucleotide-excising tRNase